MENVSLHDDQLTRIGPRSRLGAVDLRELWRYRELLYFLTWRDVKIRYKQTVIGIVWAVLQPIVTTAIFTLLFSSFARFDTGNTPYPVFALSALVIWLFVHNAITLASGSFVSNSNLVTKVYFPRLIVPLAAVLSGVFDLIFSVVILAGLILYYGIIPTTGVFLAPVFLIFAFVMSAALGTMLSALNVKFRDIKFALPFALQVWMIASPIFYPASMISGRWRLVFAVNPLTGLIDGFRSALFGLPFNWDLIGVSATSIAAMCIVSLFVFSKMEDDFADII